MSLINRMLQDLDSRGTESVGKGTMYSQIRSVPAAPKRYPIIGIVLTVLAGLIVGFLAWRWVYHSAQSINAVEPAVQTSLLGLKISSDLSVDQLQYQKPQSQSQAAEPDHSNTAVGVPATTNPREIKREGIIETNKVVLNASPTLSLQKVATSEPTVSETPVSVTPISIKKQVNDLTVQQRAENEYRKAVLLIQQARPAEALGGLEQALELDPQHVAARQTLVGLLIDAKRQDEAIRRLQDGLTLDVAQQGLAKILARLQVEKGELKQAIDTLQRTLQYAVERSDYQSFLAALLQRDGRHKEAIEHYLLALQKNPQNGVWWMGLGISLQAENRVAEAQDAFSQAKTSNTLSPELQSFVDQKLKQLQQLKH